MITFCYQCGLLIYYSLRFQRNLLMLDSNHEGSKKRWILKIQGMKMKLQGKILRYCADVGAEADMNNLDAFMPVSPIPTTRIHKDHPVDQIIEDLNSAPQTRRMTNNLKEHEEPKKLIQALKNPSWIEPMQGELLQFKLKKVWTLVDVPNGKRAIGTKWVYRNKKDERCIMIKNKARLIIFGSTKKSLCTEFKKMMHKKFQMSSMGELTFFLGQQVKQKEDGIFISQYKYVTEILNKFSFTDVKTASTPMETQNPLLKDVDGEDLDEHLYRSMIGSLMYLTSSRPDIMFAVCSCARFQVNPKSSHLHAVKRILRYLKGQPKLGLWYPKDSPFDLVAYTDSDYARASLDRKSTTGGCQFLRCRLISWQCKKQTVVANYTIEAEYIAASNCYGKEDLSTEDANGVDCLPNAAIFEQLTLIGAKPTSGIEFSSTMASAIICLATNQKFNFSKYIFDNMVKNVDSMVKLLMYPRFVQLFVNKQVGNMSHQKRIYVTPSHTKKIFGNMKREGKCFSGRVTPLFQTMMVQAHEEIGEGSKIPTDPYHRPIITQPSSSRPQRKKKSRKSKKKNTEVSQPSGSTDNVPYENVPTTSNDPLLSGEDRLKLTELMDLCTNLQKKVLDLEKAKTAQDSEIASLKKKVKNSLA
ncbi:uncharacterized mitochondrial protein-like protein [Tanacetum coccineum]